jgi:hypothetical protein
MTEPRIDRDATQKAAGQSTEPIQYPTNHVLGVVDTPEQLGAAATALTGAGFRDSEIDIACGPAAADDLAATTGRTGLAHLAIRIAERLGIADDEMNMKSRYEQALRDGRFVVLVLAPTNERKALAGQILRDHGGHFINFLGRLSIEAIHP